MEPDGIILMNTLTGIFFTSFFIAFSGAIAPGPVLTVTISESIRRGFWAGPLIVLGHGILEFFLFMAVVFGIGRFLTLPSLKGLIGILGGLTLVWFGGEMAIKSYQTQLSLADGPEGRSMHPILAGFFISMANPYWTIWWATIGLSYIALSLPFGWRGLALFYCGHILADLAWYAFISLVISSGKKNISSKIYHLVIFLFGMFLLVFGLYFLYSGLNFIRK